MTEHIIDEILFSPEDIDERNRSLVKEISTDYMGDDLVLIGILRGSFIFLADLMRALFTEDIHPQVDFMTMESYVGTESSGEVVIAKEFGIDVAGSKVIIIDDILDTGRTLKRASEHVLERGASAVKTCVLLDKPDRRAVEYSADHVGFRIENHFVVGYGLDYNGLYRELPYIARLKI